jgi:nucleotide-binding universal stress UspA family protein
MRIGSSPRHVVGPTTRSIPVTGRIRSVQATRRLEMATRTSRERLDAGRPTFTRIVVGIDGSGHALEAARQAALLQDVDARLTLLSVWDTAPAIVGGTGSEIPFYHDEELQRTAAEESLLAACDYVAPYTAATRKLVRGTPVAELLREIERDEDTLVAVGGGAVGRLLGILEGSVVTELVHRAPCSVLVARPVKDGFPGRIAVGVDGSVESAAAYAAARYLSARFGTELHAVVARGGKALDERRVVAITEGEHRESASTPVEALAAAAEWADLLVVGSRGLHGPRALGSVSERVAHEVRCSALVVREPVWQRVADELGR